MSEELKKLDKLFTAKGQLVTDIEINQQNLVEINRQINELLKIKQAEMVKAATAKQPEDDK